MFVPSGSPLDNGPSKVEMEALPRSRDFDLCRGVDGISVGRAAISSTLEGRDAVLLVWAWWNETRTSREYDAVKSCSHRKGG